MATFEGEIGPIVDYIGFELRQSGEVDLLELLRASEFELEIDDNFGRPGWTFALQIQVPQTRYRLLKTRRKAAEERILEIGREAVSGYDNAYLAGVRIVPIVVANASWKLGLEQPIQVTTEETTRIWNQGYFRLFCSHKSTIKEELHELRGPLRERGVDCFIAHDDIEPNLIWQTEIEHGLQTCDALAAFHSPGFTQSVWCLQEIGWALGRGIFVQSLLVGEAPNGFHSHRQGAAVDLAKPDRAAEQIVSILKKEPRLVSRLFGGYAGVFADAATPKAAWFAWNRFKELGDCPDSERQKIGNAFKGNPRAMESYKAVPEVLAWLGEEPPKPKIREDAFAPSVDDYDPFAEQ